MFLPFRRLAGAGVSLSVGGVMEQGDLQAFAGDFAAGDDFGGSAFHDCVGGFESDLRLVFGAAIERDYCQAFGFYLGGCAEDEIGFHGVAF